MSLWTPCLLGDSRTLRRRAQQVNVILDTGSSDLWVGSSFNPTASSTFTRSDREVGITYGSGNVNGTFATDTVTMGGFTVPEQGFCTCFFFFLSFHCRSYHFPLYRLHLPSTHFGFPSFFIIRAIFGRFLCLVISLYSPPMYSRSFPFHFPPFVSLSNNHLQWLPRKSLPESFLPPSVA